MEINNGEIGPDFYDDDIDALFKWFKKICICFRKSQQ